VRRKQCSIGAFECGARLKNAGACLLQVKILRQPPFDQAGEQGVVERAPPVRKVGRRGRAVARGDGGLT
jgi:hypothetical protein